MATEMEDCTNALATHVLDSFRDFGQRISEEEGVEDVSIHPLSKRDGFASTSLSFFRKGDSDDSSIEFTCTDTGGVVVSMFVTGAPVKELTAPAILTREGVDAIVARFISTAFKRPEKPEASLGPYD